MTTQSEYELLNKLIDDFNSKAITFWAFLRFNNIEDKDVGFFNSKYEYIYKLSNDFDNAFNILIIHINNISNANNNNIIENKKHIAECTYVKLNNLRDDYLHNNCQLDINLSSNDIYKTKSRSNNIFSFIINFFVIIA